MTMRETSSNDRVERIWSLGLLLLAALLLIPLMSHVFIGSFSRYMSDDYCTAGTLSRLGFLASQKNWYLTWSGRFSFTFTIHALQLLGMDVGRFSTALVLLIWLASATAFLFRWLKIGIKSPRFIEALILGAFALIATLKGAPNIYQSLYWLTGSVTYSLPLALITAYAAWVMSKVFNPGDREVKIGSILISFIWTLFVGGFSETIVVVQTSLLVAVLFIAWILMQASPRRRAFKILTPGLLGSIVALILVVVAPGNLVRRGLMPDTPALDALLLHTFTDLKIFTSITLRSMHWWLLIAVVLPVFIAVSHNWHIKEKDWGFAPVRGFIPIVLIPIVTVLLMFSSILPYEYALSNYPDGRVLITTQYILISGLILWGGALGRFLRVVVASRWRFSAGLCFLFLVLLIVIVGGQALMAASSALTWQGEVREFSTTWDERDRTARDAVRAGKQELALRSLSHIGGLSEITYDPAFWVNRCVAQAYGLEQVIAK